MLWADKAGSWPAGRGFPRACRGFSESDVAAKEKEKNTSMHCVLFLVVFAGKTRTKEKYRVVYTDHQRLELEKEFHFNRYITIRRKSELAVNLGLSERQVCLRLKASIGFQMVSTCCVCTFTCEKFQKGLFTGAHLAKCRYYHQHHVNFHIYIGESLTIWLYLSGWLIILSDNEIIIKISGMHRFLFSIILKIAAK